jgi:hypothetical protein
MIDDASPSERKVTERKIENMLKCKVLRVWGVKILQ